MKNSILIVDGNVSSLQELKKIVEGAAFQCWCTHDAEEARLILEESRPSLILLDWNSTSVSGLEFLSYIRKRVALLAIPIIMLSDRENEQEKIIALEAGADDFLDKPFSPGELLARIQALLRRVDSRLQGDVLEVAGLRLELHNKVVYVGPAFTPLKIGRMAFQLLAFLVAHTERVFSRGELLEHVWGESRGVNERTVDVHVRHLRRDLSASGHDKYLQTVRGCGYRFSLRCGGPSS
ncbi:MAG: winged helix-turn-helix domain-containing protein [Magnetococcales bacterium]|nr:winged helix-turn-helix domain-containing protein [Magnetococcales bacterium]